MKHFPLDTSAGLPRAIVRVRLFEVDTDAPEYTDFIVDSGASRTFAPLALCPERHSRNSLRPSGAFDAQGQPLVGIPVGMYAEVKGLDKPLHAEVWFSPGMPAESPGLLGLRGFFDQHIVTFRAFDVANREKAGFSVARRPPAD